MNKKHSLRGFSLIELMISLSLMIIIVGSVIVIFTGVTGMMTTTEERMFIFQNARAGLNSLVQDVVNTKNISGFPLNIQNPQSDESPQLLMKFLSTTSWIDGDEGNIVTSDARIYYYLEKKRNRWTLKRHIVDVTAKDEVNPIELAPDPDPVNEPYEHTLANDIVCQFIAVNPTTKIPICEVDYFFFDGTNVNVVRPQNIIFDNDAIELENRFPMAIRFNMDVTDDKGQSSRTFSKVIQLLPTQD